MMKIMGFANFDTSKNQKVKGNDIGDIRVSSKRKYRQYRYHDGHDQQEQFRQYLNRKRAREREKGL